MVKQKGIGRSVSVYIFVNMELKCMFKKNMVDETYMPVYIDASIHIRKCHAMGVDTQHVFWLVDCCMYCIY